MQLENGESNHPSQRRLSLGTGPTGLKMQGTKKYDLYLYNHSQKEIVEESKLACLLLRKQ